MIKDYVARLFSVGGKSILFLQKKTFRECIGKYISRGIDNPEFHDCKGIVMIRKMSCVNWRGFLKLHSFPSPFPSLAVGFL